MENNHIVFRKNKSAVNALLELIKTVTEGQERKKTCKSVLLGLSKVFDCVHNKILLQQLLEYELFTACNCNGLRLSIVAETSFFWVVNMTYFIKLNKVWRDPRVNPIAHFNFYLCESFELIFLEWRDDSIRRRYDSLWIHLENQGYKIKS